MMSASQAGIPHTGVRGSSEGSTVISSISALTAGLQPASRQQDSDDDYDE